MSNIIKMCDPTAIESPITIADGVLQEKSI